MGTLVFLLTFLGLLVISAFVLHACLTRRWARARRMALLGGGWLGLYVAALLGVAALSTAPPLTPDQERCFDEMCFSALRTALAAPGPGGVAYRVTVQLRNAARRTTQRPDSAAIHLCDGAGPCFEPAAAGASAWAQLVHQPIAPGGSTTQEILFMLPAPLAAPYLLVTEGGLPSGLIIDDENSPFHAQTMIRLVPAPAPQGRGGRGWAL